MSGFAKSLIPALFVGAALSLSPIVYAACSADSKNYDELMKLGEEAFRANKLEDAYDCYDYASNLPRREPESFYMMGLVEKTKNGGKRSEKVISHYEDAIRHESSEKKLFHRLRLALLYLEDPMDNKQAEKVLSKIERKAVASLVTNLLLADAMLSTDTYEWKEVAKRLDGLSQAFHELRTETGIKDEATVYALKAFMQSIWIDQTRKMSKVEYSQTQRANDWELAWADAEKARKLSEKRDHYIANFVVGFLLNQPEAKEWPMPALTELQRDIAKKTFEMQIITESIEILGASLGELFQNDHDVLNLLIDRAENLRSKWMAPRLAKLQDLDFASPKIELPGYKDSTFFKTNLDHVWLLIRATDDNKLVKIVIRKSWDSKEDPILVDDKDRYEFERLLPAIELPITDVRYRPPYYIWIDAYDKHGNSTKFQLNINYVPPAPKLRAYLTGNTDYPPNLAKLDPLPGVKADLDGINAYFLNEAKKVYDRYFINKDETGIKNTLYQIRQISPRLDSDLLLIIQNAIVAEDSENEVVFYYSGHGTYISLKDNKDKKMGCIVLYNKLASKPEQACVQIEDLFHAVDKSGAKMVSLIFDSCHADPTGTQITFDRKKLRYVLTSVRSEQTAKMKGPKGGEGSYFTQTFLQALQDDTELSGGELENCGCRSFEWAYNEVVKIFVENKIIENQHPQRWGSKQDHQVFWQSRAAHIKEWLNSLDKNRKEEGLLKNVETIISDDMPVGKEKNAVLYIIGELTKENAESRIEFLKGLVGCVKRKGGKTC